MKATYQCGCIADEAGTAKFDVGAAAECDRPGAGERLVLPLFTEVHEPGNNDAQGQEDEEDWYDHGSRACEKRTNW